MGFLDFFRKKDIEEIEPIRKPNSQQTTAYTLQIKVLFGDDREKLIEKTNLFARSIIARHLDLRILSPCNEINMQSIRAGVSRLLWISTIKYVAVATSRPLSEVFTVRMEVFRNNSIDKVIKNMNDFALGVEAINLEIRQTPQQFLKNTKEVEWYGYVTYRIGPN